MTALTIAAIETRYRGYRFRSRLEARWAVFFDRMGIEYDYEDEGLRLPDGGYLPDFYLPGSGRDFYVEIKRRHPEDEERLKAIVRFRDIAAAGKRGLIICGQPWIGEFDIMTFGPFTYPSAGYSGGDDAARRVLDLWLGIFETPIMETAFEAARSARFEHGETPQ